MNEVPLHEVPPFLISALLTSEDQRFYSHGGTDWRGVSSAMLQAVTSLSFVRGGSSISEQSVRLLHPRRRTLLSRTIEVLEARDLEERFSKNEILEFYLNQVPFAARRRGVVQGARLLYDRDLSTLSEKEILALVVMVRAPAYYDARKSPDRVESAVTNLLSRMERKELISPEDSLRIKKQKLVLRAGLQPLEASHFVTYARNRLAAGEQLPAKVETTLDGSIQRRLQRIMNQRLAGLKERGVRNGALLAIDNDRGEVIAWVNGGDFFSSDSGSQIDAVITPRQPGSTLKPFVYAAAFEKGWTPATTVFDGPLARPVAAGLHNFRNYSGSFHGPVSVRDALGNSLNIPAVHAVQMVGIGPFLEKLHALGFESLDREPDFYGEGVALGAGEVSLYELVRGYFALAGRGQFRELAIVQQSMSRPMRAVFSPVAASLIADILSDSGARQLEFSDDSILDLPIQTAVKTGTSTDYRDAWAIGFSSRFTIGVWMGNLDREPMGDVTGSTGPALVLRAAFAELERRSDPRAFKLEGGLVRTRVCRQTGLLAGPRCSTREELFPKLQVPKKQCSDLHEELGNSPAYQSERPLVRLPSPGLIAALDPRIPDELEAFSFELASTPKDATTEWFVDGTPVGASSEEFGRFLWNPKRGKHLVHAIVKNKHSSASTQIVGFLVK